MNTSEAWEAWTLSRSLVVTGCEHQETGQVPGRWHYIDGHLLLRAYYMWGLKPKSSQPHHKPYWAGSIAIPILKKTLRRCKARSSRTGGRVRV